MWCVTREDLIDLKKQLKKAISEGQLKPPPKDDEFYMEEYDGVAIERWDPSVYMVMENFIKPGLLKLESRTSWALERHPGGLKCDVFATHAWAEGIFEFIEAALQSFHWPSKNMYVCFLGNPQDDDSLKELLGNICEPNESPFAKALESAKWFIVIPTKRICIYERLWCVFEIFIAQQKVHKGGNLKVRLRSIRQEWVVVSQLVIMMIGVPLPGFLLSFYVISVRLGHVVGPLMWLMIFHMIGSSVWFLIHMFSDKCLVHQHPHDIPFWELCLMRIWTYARLALFGLGGGFALRELSELHSQAGVNWERGEGFACWMVFISFAVMYTYDMMVTMRAEIVHREGGKLDRFETVRNAECFSKDDEVVINREIEDWIEDIDEAIRDVRVIGKYDEEVLYNLRMGMPPEVVRQGVNPFHILCGTCAWAFWLMTDLYAHGWGRVSLAGVVVFSIAGLLVVYGPRTYTFRGIAANDKFIFALTSFMWFGIFFCWISNTHEFFRRIPVKQKQMFLQTLPLLLVMMSQCIIVNALYYFGVLAWYKRLCYGPTVHDHHTVKTSYHRQGFDADYKDLGQSESNDDSS